ncbi:hypothetical protein [Pleionea sp. CnH1-48]|uniref:hypothetical protein n=1 Tax=Pleionea sp. CnH1-48 TaxID=2954494 RepID=UPI0020981745|nr:hypothetical protein [Pleionea sp. CnH1-48]MCO7225923.1 hypothetical protein [Pleionea sp. CnH1-48]
MDAAKLTERQKQALHRLVYNDDFKLFLTALEEDFQRQIETLLITDTAQAGKGQGYCYALKRILEVAERYQKTG